jgi:CheY-like chemotaxis protein
MENASKLIQALASIAWPLLVAFLLIRFGSVIKSVLETAKGRKFTFKVAGNELTMEEASEQQRVLINDLQKHIVEIQKRLEISTLTPTRAEIKQIENALPKVKSILWVDDNPKNNAFLIANLSELGIEVDTALSTSEALSKFESKKYDRVISDMGRKEPGKYNQTAGLYLTKQLRAIDKKVPILIYCSSRAAQEFRSEALAAGANEITSSPTVLLNALRLRPDANAT